MERRKKVRHNGTKACKTLGFDHSRCKRCYDWCMTIILNYVDSKSEEVLSPKWRTFGFGDSSKEDHQLQISSGGM